MPVVPNCAQLVPEYGGGSGATAVNVLHFLDIGGGFDQANGDYILQAWIDFWTTIACDQWSVSGLAKWRDLSVDPIDELVAVATGEGGDGSDAPSPAQATPVLSLICKAAGRRGRGRIYLPGMGQEQAYGSTMITSYVALAVANFGTFSSDIAVNAGWVPAVYSRTDGLARPVVAIDMSRIVDTQRRRAERLETY